MREKKIKELQQEKTKHIILFILNTLMALSQIFIISFYNNMNSLMIFGCIGIAFGTGLNALVRFLQICDTKKSLETYGE